MSRSETESLCPCVTNIYNEIYAGFIVGGLVLQASICKFGCVGASASFQESLRDVRVTLVIRAATLVSWPCHVIYEIGVAGIGIESSTQRFSDSCRGSIWPQEVEVTD
jgi:hypothetical protein